MKRTPRSPRNLLFGLTGILALLLCVVWHGFAQTVLIDGGTPAAPALPAIPDPLALLLAHLPGWFVALVAWMGLARLAAKPIFSFLVKTVETSGSDAEKARLHVIESSTWFKVLCYLIDYVASCKVGTSRSLAILAKAGTMCAMGFLLVGCSHFGSEIVSVDNMGRPVKTKVSVFTFLDGKSELTKFLAHQTTRTNGIAAQSIGLASLQDESSGTNVVSLVERVTGAVVEAAVTAAKK